MTDEELRAFAIAWALSHVPDDFLRSAQQIVDFIRNEKPAKKKPFIGIRSLERADGILADVKEMRLKGLSYPAITQLLSDKYDIALRPHVVRGLTQKHGLNGTASETARAHAAKMRAAVSAKREAQKAKREACVEAAS